MERQERKPRSTKSPSPSEHQDVTPNPKVIETGKKLQEDIDHLVEEIDKALGENAVKENAAEFVKNNVQKGGE